MDPITKPMPDNLPTDPSFQVMPQEGKYQASIPKPPVTPSAGLPPMPHPPLNSNLPPRNISMPQHYQEAPAGSWWGKRISWIILIIIVLGGLGYGAYYLLGQKSKTPAAPTTKLSAKWLSDNFGSATCTDQTKCGDNADPDNDGLSNYDEFVAGTSPTNPDTDGDGISDGDEVHIYKTDPTLKYTDRRDIVAANGWTDGFQIRNGYDPLTPALKFNETRLAQIAADTAKYGLHAPTQNTLAPIPSSTSSQ